MNIRKRWFKYRLKHKYHHEKNRTDKLKMAISYFPNPINNTKPSNLKNLYITSHYISLYNYHLDAVESLSILKEGVTVPTLKLPLTIPTKTLLNQWVFSTPNLKILSLYDVYLHTTKHMVVLKEILDINPQYADLYHRKMFPLVETYFTIIKILSEFDE
jgi:hypothetical protein